MFDKTLQYDVVDATSSVANANAAVCYLDQQVALGSGKAGFELALLLSEHLVLGDDQVRAHLRSLKRSEGSILEAAFLKLHDEAMAGDGRAMHYLAHYYQNGHPPLGRTCMAMFTYWVNRARLAGYVLSQY